MGDEATPAKERPQNKHLSKTGAPRTSGERDLTLKQALFCLEYVASDGKVGESALKAGYSEGSVASIGSQLLEMPKIQARIASIQKNRAIRLEVDADWVIKELKITFRNARKANDHAGQNRALELLGKAQGMFTDAGAKLDAQVTVNLKFPAKVPIDAGHLVEIDPDADDQ